MRQRKNKWAALINRMIERNPPPAEEDDERILAAIFDDDGMKLYCKKEIILLDFENYSEAEDDYFDSVLRAKPENRATDEVRLVSGCVLSTCRNSIRCMIDGHVHSIRYRSLLGEGSKENLMLLKSIGIEVNFDSDVLTLDLSAVEHPSTIYGLNGKRLQLLREKRNLWTALALAS